MLLICKKKNYYIYLENTNIKYCSVVKFIYIREIDENKII